MSVKVIIVKRPANADHHACIDGRKDMWGCGKTPREALGALIQGFPKEFGIEIVYPSGNVRK